MTTEPLPLARPNIHGTFGACASTHWIASAVGLGVLERGGNAFDAATAAAFVLHVVEPHLNGPGGDLVAIVAPAGGEPIVLCGQGPAPAGATISHYAREGLAAVPGSGALAAAVPGAVDGWLLLLRDYGTWELGDILEYAIHYAESGHPVLGRVVDVIAAVRELFVDHWRTSADLWLQHSAPPRTGELFTNLAYARTLRRLRDEAILAAGRRADRRAVIDAARRTWATGFVAQSIHRFVADTPHLHSTGGVHRGVLDSADLARYQAHFEAAVSAEFRGHRIMKAGAWSQGPVLLQTLAILDAYSDAELDVDTANGVHLAVEALKLAFADRDAYYGDGLKPDVLDTLLSPAYSATRRQLIGEHASVAVRPGHVPGLRAPFTAVLERADGPTSEAAGEPTVRPTGEVRGDTCHVDVIDRWGNAISATPSGGWLQSSPTIPELGFCLGTRLQMTHLDAASPSALRPGMRPRTTLSPTIVTTADTITALGTPGGDQQDQWQLLYLLRTLTAGFGAQQAIEAPAFHTTSFPGSFWPRTWEPGGLVIENRVMPELLADLDGRGHRITRSGAWSLGRLSSVRLDRSTGLITAAANPRGAQGYAVGR
ncbi:gamma-glutamyltransferase family protein [Dactylosporangium sp. CA-233914]|uniref:gamma-glutamyltransferase family protein n=1 Tax=Dactylosporangium sp. CA-233914 TaxID=3239934 RepID=UPI003D8AC617